MKGRKSEEKPEGSRRNENDGRMEKKKWVKNERNKEKGMQEKEG